MAFGTGIIPQAEGRRDPFLAVFCHMDLAPASITYDFACSLFEYIMNREALLFLNTRYVTLRGFCVNDAFLVHTRRVPVDRFFVDKFHLQGHAPASCSPGFSANRLGADAVADGNDSICEQFHARLKHNKGHLQAMTQLRFLFTLVVITCSLSPPSPFCWWCGSCLLLLYYISNAAVFMVILGDTYDVEHGEG